MKNLFFISLIFLILIGCVPALSTPVSVDLSPTVFILPSATATTYPITRKPYATPALTTTPIASSTALLTKAFDVSAILTQTPSPAAECPQQNKTIVPNFATLFEKDKMYGSGENREIEQPVLDFLNAGGLPSAVIDAFTKGFEENNFNFFQQDVTNDQVPELFIGDFLLHIFGCKNGKYITLMKMDPGGAIAYSNILHIQDMNLNGVPDLLISEWIGDINLYIPDIYRIMEWDGTSFKDLITQSDFESRYGAGVANDGFVSINGRWNDGKTPEKELEVVDVDKNGTFELILRGGLPTHPDTQMRGPWRAETDIYMWNGKGFVIHAVIPDPPVYRFQAMQDAEYAFFDGEYDKAVTLYREVIFSDKLEWWSSDRWVNESQKVYAGYSGDPTPTPLPPDDSEYHHLSAYARYRIMLIYLKGGLLSDAKVIYDTLQKKHPDGKEGHIVAELATVLWDEFLISNDLSASCSKAIEFTNANVFEIFNYVGSVKTDKSFEWTFHGIQKEHSYTSDDICPFK